MNYLSKHEATFRYSHYIHLLVANYPVLHIVMYYHRIVKRYEQWGVK